MKHQSVILIKLAFTTACVSQKNQVSEKPNIIYILADDLGYGDVSCYNPESKLLTPRIDKMAKEGMLFTDVHSTHACTPTRYEILTGRYAFRALEPMRVLRSYDPPLIPEGRLTVPKLLRENGYFTACIGKWHLGWDWPLLEGQSEPDFTQVIENGSVTRGFDEYFGTDVPNYPPYAFIENERLTAQLTGYFPGGDRELFVFQSGPIHPEISEELYGKLKKIRFPGGYFPEISWNNETEIFPAIRSSSVSGQDIADAMRYILDAYPKTIKTETKDTGNIIGLPYPFNSPCIDDGFTQLYYWDTYFTNLGLLGIDMVQQAKNNTDNLMFLVEKTGFVPNANRASMANRSQIPMLAAMIRDIFCQFHDREWVEYAYRILKTEYNFWMMQRISPTGLNRPFNSATEQYLLNFYNYLENSRLIGLNHAKKEEKLSFSSHSLSEAEVWDFTPRFDRRAEDFCPVDQNSALYICEEVLAQLANYLNNGEETFWKERSIERKVLINKYLWNEEIGCYTDYDFANRKKGKLVSAAALWPMWAGVASLEQAEKVVDKMRSLLEYDFGLSTCEKESWPFLYQWDYPNAWPPLQCIAIQALDRYGFKEDARRIAEKYVTTVVRNFRETGLLWEKYNALTGNIEVADEYEMPPMVGWTAGTFIFALDYLGPVE